MNDLMREEFEVAYKLEVIRQGKTFDSVVFTRESSGEYFIGLVQSAWWAWQASRESLVIELPAENPLGKGSGDCEGGFPSFEQQCAAECNFVIRDCRESIHAAGVKTK